MVKKPVTYQRAWYALAVTRVLLAFVFLWAFLDKTFGLGVATPAAQAWVNGTSPTAGFLLGAGSGAGPFAGFFASMAGVAVVDWLFMLGLLGIGLALLLGIALRVAAVAGTLMMLMMWMASLPLANNPYIDDHLVYAAIMWVIAAGRREFSIAPWWLKLGIVQRNKWLW